MTSGNIAVFDHDALRHVEYVSEYLKMFDLQSPASSEMETRLREAWRDAATATLPKSCRSRG